MRVPTFAGTIDSNPETRAFWDACAQGRLLLRRCDDCGRAHWYPRAICPHCGGDTAWFEASGLGTIYTFSVVERAAEPYAIAYVALAEGTTMMTNIVDCPLSEIAIGGAVRVVFKPTAQGPSVPMFTPAPQDRSAEDTMQNEIEKPGDVRYGRARILAERAREHYLGGDTRTGDDLARQAADLDREAAATVLGNLGRTAHSGS